jgi:hypothetical protein
LTGLNRLNRTALPVFAVLGALLVVPAGSSAQAYAPATPAPARPPGFGPDRARVSLFFGAHLGGRASQTVGGRSVTQGLGPSPSGGIRVEVPVGRFFVFGGFFDFASLQARSAPLGVGGWFKGRVVLDVGASVLELYVGVPIGLSVWIPPISGVDPEAGATLGLLGGAQAHLSDTIALFVETGFRFDYFSLSGVETTYLQGSVHVGVSFGF